MISQIPKTNGDPAEVRVKIKLDLSGVIQGETAEFIEKTEIEEQVPIEEPTKDSSQQPKSMETEPSATTPTSSSSAGYFFIIQQTLRKKNANFSLSLSL